MDFQYVDFSLKMLLIIFILFGNLNAFDRSYFYRASSFWNEPRFERDWLTTINTQIAGGATHKSRNKCYKKRALFDLYGPDKLSFENIPVSKKLYFTGVFNIFEVDLNFYQNLKKRFFFHVHVPALSVELFPEKIKYFYNKPVNCINNKLKLF